MCQPRRSIQRTTSHHNATKATANAADDASRVAWLPLEIDVELTAAVERVVGRDRMRRWARDAIVRSTEGPLLRPIVAGLQAMGLTPHNALRRAPYGWTLIYRHCGVLHYQRDGDHGVVLVHEDVPALMFDSPGYPHGIGGTFDGVMELAGGQDVESLVEPETAARRYRYRCRWR